jgi:hypothetical protein
LLFEGRSLTELLARVRAEHGADVRIVAADRRRSGGVAGFFARETYAVTVELDELPTPPDALAPDLTDPGLPALTDTIEAIEAAERAQTALVLDTPPLSTSGLQFATVLEKLRALDSPPPAAPAVAPAPSTAAAPIAVDAETWAQLAGVLRAAVPGLQLPATAAGVALVVLVPTAPPAPAPPPPPATVLTVPRQGRHRRALV